MQNFESQNFGSFKNQLVDNEPLFYSTRLRNIRINSTKSLMVEGKKFPMSSTGFESLRSLVKMPKRFQSRVTKYIGDDAPAQLMDALRKGIASMKDDKQLEVVIDRNDQEIVALKENFSRITRQGYFDLVERIVDRYGLDIVGFSENGSGKIQVNTEKKGQQYSLSEYEDEVFRSGPSFVSNYGSLEIHSYMLRLICTNGMIGMREDQDFQASLSKEDMTNFFEYINELAENHFVPEDFRENIDRAKNTPASLREMEQVREKIHRYYDGKNSDYNDWFVPYNQVCQSYKKEVGLDPAEMSITQRKNAITPVSFWDLINSYTEFASHDQSGRGFRFDESQANDMISEAGSMLSKATLDAENTVRTPSFNNFSF